jgi:hypothetical protein
LGISAYAIEYALSRCNCRFLPLDYTSSDPSSTIKTFMLMSTFSAIVIPLARDGIE